MGECLSRKSDFVEDLNCPICEKVFQDPIVLMCGHNFCRKCIYSVWVSGDNPKACVQCHKLVEGEMFVANIPLSKMADKMRASKWVARKKQRDKESPNRLGMCSAVRCSRTSVKVQMQLCLHHWSQLAKGADSVLRLCDYGDDDSLLESSSPSIASLRTPPMLSTKDLDEEFDEGAALLLNTC